MAGATLALVLLAAACGTDATETEVGAASTTEPTTGSTTGATSAGTEATTGTSSDSTDGADGADGSDGDAAPAGDVGEHAFPDLDTVDISDGSTVNLAQALAGGDTPVLLWFWAPH